MTIFPEIVLCQGCGGFIMGTKAISRDKRFGMNLVCVCPHCGAALGNGPDGWDVMNEADFKHLTPGERAEIEKQQRKVRN
jgi:hypothetical protein